MPLLPERLADPVVRRAGRLMMNAVDGPQRDYYLGVRMIALRDPGHGYLLCDECGEPFLPQAGNHTWPIHKGSRTAQYRRLAAAAA